MGQICMLAPFDVEDEIWHGSLQLEGQGL